jgi:hypothetical protein
MPSWVIGFRLTIKANFGKTLKTHKLKVLNE